MKIFYKSESQTLYNFILKLKQKGLLTDKFCYCGRLDPMAKGKMLFLEDDERKQMEDYLTCDKEYEFEICLGISTDTDDILGIINEINFDTLETFDSSSILDEQIKLLSTQTIQKYHRFSAFQIKKDNTRINLCDLSKQNKLKEEDIPSKPCKIYNITKVNKKIVNLKYYLSIIKQKIQDLYDPNNYYRKKEIIDKWTQFDSSISDTSDIHLITYRYKIKVTSGFYIRQFIADLKKKCNFPLMVLNINRTQIMI